MDAKILLAISLVVDTEERVERMRRRTAVLASAIARWHVRTTEFVLLRALILSSMLLPLFTSL